MGQEASLPSQQGDLPNVVSPQAVASAIPSQDTPQARTKPPESDPEEHPATTTTTAPFLSRTGLSSMIQRMGGSSTTPTMVLPSKYKWKRGEVTAMGTLVDKMTDILLGEEAPPQQQLQQPPLQQPSPQPPLQQPPSDEDDWEKAWAEDSESDEDDEEEDLPKSSSEVPDTGHLRLDAISPVGPTVSETFRPDLDTGHGSSIGVGMDVTSEWLGTCEQPSCESPAMGRGEKETQEPITEETDRSEEWEGYHHEIHYGMDIETERPCVAMFDPALRVLGRGSFGRVVLVQKRYGQSQGGLYAMKILRKSHLVRRRQIERTQTERKVLSVLNHPFVMKLYYAFQTTEKLYLVLDYCPGGELFFHLSRYRRFQEPVARFYVAELLLAIGHLHKHGIIYRDLKPENVLLDAYGHVKLGDFGLAKDGIRHPTQGAKSTCGTPEYMAPEVLNQTGHGFCVDYWGLGMILFEMMTGLPPWYTTDRSKLFRRLRSAPLIFPNEIQFSPHCKACIAGLLERDPRLRLGVLGLRSAMRHEFFYRRINFEALMACQIAAPIRPCEGWRQFTNKNSNGDGSDSISASLRGHSANPSLESASMGQITAELLDVATENFDETFRRMPIETEDYEKQQQAAGHAPITDKELNEQTFRGFTFDGDELVNEEALQAQIQRQLEHHSQQQQPSHHQAHPPTQNQNENERTS